MSNERTPLSVAQEAFDAGYDPLVVQFGGKECFETSWTRMPITREGLKERFGANGHRSSVGVRWGRKGRFDADLDCWEARALAPYFLPRTPARVGRPSARSGHWIYESSTGRAPATMRTFNDPDAPPPQPGDHQTRIVELLGPGTQTVIWGIHGDSDERIGWEENGPPAVVEPRVVIRALHKIAAATLIVRRWKPGQRQDMALCIAGALLPAGWSEKETAEFLIAINAVAPAGEDDERTKKRLWDAVTGTSAKLSKGDEKVWGRGQLAKLIGKQEVIDCFASWLGLSMAKGTAPEGEAEASAPAPVWDEPVPLVAVQRPAFPLHVLPAWLRTYTTALATAKQAPVDLAVWQTMAAISAAIAGRVVVLVKPDYYETANIWVCSILESGERKTPIVLATRKPIEQWEKERIKAAEPQIAQKESARRTLEARLRHLETEAAKAPQGERVRKEAEAQRVASELAAFKVPTKPRHLTDDCTPEKLGTLLGENEERMAVLSDEGSIFPMIFGRYSGMPNYEIYLKSYQGSPHPIDRGGRTGELLEEPLLTLGISAQPEVIKGVGSQPDARGRGLVGRFIYSRPESLLGGRPGNAPPLDPGLQQDYTNRLRHLLAIERTVVDGRSCAHTLKLSDGAYACWVRLHDALEQEMGRDGAFHGFTDWAGKLCGQVVRVAGILHMAEYATTGRAWHGEIGEATFRAAIPIGLYMIQHARAALGMMRSAVGHEDARKVLAWITRDPDVSVEFKRTQAIRGTRCAAEDLTKALGVLEEHGYIQPVPGEREKKTGPVPAKYLVNPALSAEQAEAQPARQQPFAALLSQFPQETAGMLLGEIDNCSNSSNYSRGAKPSAPPRPGALDALFAADPQGGNCSNSSNCSAGPEPQQAGEAATPSIEELTLAWPCCGGRVSRFSAKHGGAVCARCHPNQ